ncbi:oligosaccharide translocation protein RFT1 [Naviculisporaceae sp. PSN 640]
MPKDETASQRAVQGASLLILLQVVSRAVTFIANQLLLRFLTAQLLGVSTQLEVYYLSVIFFARESLRVAIQRQESPSSSPKKDGKDDEAKATQAVVNLGYLAIALGVPLAGVFGWMYLHSLSTETLASTPYLVTSLYIYALAAVIELISEPAFVVMQARLQFRTRATAESVATFLRCIVTLGSAIWGATMMAPASKSDALRLGVLPFALGQLSYGLGLLAVYSFYGAGLARREGFSLLPRRISSTSSTQDKRSPTVQEFAYSYFYRPTLQLASSMMTQSIVKHVLTQGDTLLVSTLSTPTAQGIYALANNYGGLIARLVFQPIEESSRSYFSKLLATTSPSPSPASPSQSPLKQASTSLTSLLKVYTLFSTLILPIAPHAAPLLLTIVAGKQWSTPVAAQTLSLYTVYIPLLAINGITEAFVSSVATKSQVHAQSAWMTVFTLIFATAGFVFLRVLDMGARGLVYANGINMFVRILWSGVFIRRYFADKQRGGDGTGKKGDGESTKDKEILEFDLLGLLPKPWVVVVAVVTSAMVKRVPAFLGQLSFLGKYVGDMSGAVVGAKQAMVQLVAMAVVSLPFVGLLLFSERHYLLQGYRSLAKR